MKSSWLCSAAVAACVSLAAQVGRADTHVVVHAGAWDAFEGTADDTPVCGVSAKEEGIYFGVKYFEAAPTFTIQLGGKNFIGEKDVKQPVLMQFDRRRPWRATATGMRWGGDSGLQFDVS
jgi:hypothetical protein